MAMYECTSDPTQNCTSGVTPHVQVCIGSEVHSYIAMHTTVHGHVCDSHVESTHMTVAHMSGILVADEGESMRTAAFPPEQLVSQYRQQIHSPVLCV